MIGLAALPLLNRRLPDPRQLLPAILYAAFYMQHWHCYCWAGRTRHRSGLKQAVTVSILDTTELGSSGYRRLESRADALHAVTTTLTGDGFAEFVAICDGLMPLPTLLPLSWTPPNAGFHFDPHAVITIKGVAELVAFGLGHGLKTASISASNHATAFDGCRYRHC
jgi:hypothetical protein